jgi:uncharacterized protein
METLASVKTEQNIATVQSAYADFAKGDIHAVANACTEDIVWGSYDNSTVPYAGNFHGKKGVVDFFTILGASIDYLEFQPKEFFGSADRVFVKGYQKGKVKSNGRIFGHDFLMEFQLRDGKVSSFFAWVDTRNQAEAFAK